MKRPRLLFYLKIYIKIITQDIKTKMAYRADFIISNIAMVMYHATGFAAFWILFRNFPSIMGWKYEEILFFYGFSLIAFTPMQCLFDNIWHLRGYIFSGDFIKYCFRPINLFFYYMSEVFDLKGLGQLVSGIVILVYAWKKLALDFSFLIALNLLLNLIAASLIMIGLLIIAGATIFWTINSIFLMEIAYKFRDYARYPITIFNGFLRFIFTFIIPMAFISYYPSLAFLRPGNVPLFTWLCPVIGALFFVLSYFIWMKGASEYSGTGS